MEGVANQSRVLVLYDGTVSKQDHIGKGPVIFIIMANYVKK